MSKKKQKKKSFGYTTFVIGLIAAVLVIVFISCINWIMSTVEKKGMESLEAFALQTGLRLEDLIDNNRNVMYQLKSDITSDKSLAFENIKPTLQSYRDNWNAANVGLLLKNKTAIGADGESVEFENWIDPRSVEGYAYGVRVAGNKVNGNNVLSFEIYNEVTVDGNDCIGLFMNFPLYIINSMMENTTYGSNNNAFISVIDQEGNTIWKSDVQNNNFTNMYDDLQTAKFANSGELEKIKLRLDLNHSGTAIYDFNNEKRALAYIPLETNYWRVIIGLPYNTIIEQSGNNMVFLIFIASVIVMVSMCVSFWFIYRQRNIELSKQKSEVAAARAISEAKAKSDFLSRMSHELRTPLNGIIGMVELATRYGDDKQQRDEYLRKIKVSSDFLVSLINDILDVAKIEHNKIVLYSEPFNIKTMCQNISDIFYPLAFEKNLEFTVNYEELKHDCYIGDETRIKQVISNLLSNAFKFTDKGFVKCTLRETEALGHTVVEIKVEDTGVGISQEFINRIFTPFEQENTSATRNKTGSGLGLSICISLVKLAGGTITVDSIVGRGSLFTVTLPLESVGDDFIETAKTTNENIRLDGINILLAEDNTVNAEIATELLKDSGATVELVQNGEEACQRFENSAAGEFDVILMDIQMPKMDGIQATKNIRASKRPDAKNIPIIAMTANALKEDREKSLAAGMNDHLSKPFYIDEICKTILLHCNKKN